jgi:hypothetical protein
MNKEILNALCPYQVLLGGKDACVSTPGELKKKKKKKRLQGDTVISKGNGVSFSDCNHPCQHLK